jgi:hypothetical protein
MLFFRHEDGRMQIIPKKGGQKVKRVYIKQIGSLGHWVKNVHYVTLWAQRLRPYRRAWCDW